MSYTRGTVRTMIQRRIGDSSGNFYGTTFYDDIIDEKAKTWGVKVATYVPNYYFEHDTITGVDDATDSSNEYYQMPSDFFKFISLERRFGSGSGIVYQSLREINAEDQDRYRLYDIALLTLPDSLTNYEQTVSIWDNRVRILPAPVTNSYVYQLKYVRRPIAASADESLIDLPDEWINCLVIDSAILVLSQLGDNSTVELLERQLQSEFKLVKDSYRRNFGASGQTTMDRMTF